MNLPPHQFFRRIPNWKGIIFGTVVVVLVVVTYMPSLRSWFDSQDFISFLNPLNSDTPVLEYFNRAWSWTEVNPVREVAPVSDVDLIGFYRPLTSAMFMVEFPLFGDDPLGYRIMNLLMHLVCVLAVIRLAANIGHRNITILAGGLLFAIHPGMSWAVEWITARNDVLVCLFSLLAVDATIRLVNGSGSTSRAWLPAVLSLLAAASKELGMVSFVAVPILYFLWPGERRVRRVSLILCISTAAVACLYMGARLLVFKGMGGYSAYASVLSIPGSFLVLLGQITGAAFTDIPVLKAFFLGLPAVIILLYARLDPRRWVRVLLFVLMLGMFGFQSLLSEQCLHYIYAPAAIYVAFLVAFASRIRIRQYRWLKPVISLMVIIVAVMGALKTHEELHSLYMMNIDKRHVFLATELMQDAFPSGQSFVLLISSEETTGALDEIKHIGLYLSYFRPEHGCTFSVRKDISSADDRRVFVWDGRVLTPWRMSDSTSAL